MTPAQAEALAARKRCLDTLESVVRQAEAIGCDCVASSPVGPHENWCHRPRAEALLELMRDNFGGSGE